MSSKSRSTSASTASPSWRSLMPPSCFNRSDARVSHFRYRWQSPPQSFNDAQVLPSPQSPDAAVPPAPATPVKKRERLGSRFFGFFCWLYLGITVAVWLFLHFAGDRWWIATLLLFGPLWTF